MSKSGAHNAVLNAVKSGKLPHVSTQKCKMCGGQAQAYHHIKGYDKPNYLDVIPVCQKCHTEKYHPRNGSNMGNLKLTDTDVRVARKMRKNGLKVYNIAKFFGVGAAFMGQILRGKSYKWVK